MKKSKDKGQEKGMAQGLRKNIQKGYVKKHQIPKKSKEKISGTMPKVIRKNSGPNAQDMKTHMCKAKQPVGLCICAVHSPVGVIHFYPFLYFSPCSTLSVGFFIIMTGSFICSRVTVSNPSRTSHVMVPSAYAHAFIRLASCHLYWT